MKYQEVYRTLNEGIKKKANIKKLASIIGIVKRAAQLGNNVGSGLAAPNESYRTERNAKYISNLPNNAITEITGNPQKVAVIPGNRNTTLAQIAKKQRRRNGAIVSSGVNGLGYYVDRYLGNLSAHKQSLSQQDLKNFQGKLQDSKTRQEALRTVPGYQKVMDYLPVNRAKLFWEAARRQAKNTSSQVANTIPA